MSGCPSFGVTVDEGDVSRDGDIVHAALQQALILVLAVDDADGAVFLHEGDREEFAFGFSDQVVEFGLHGLGVVFLRNGEIVRFLAIGCKLFFVQKFQNVGSNGRDGGESDEGGGDVDGRVLVHLVCGVR